MASISEPWRVEADDEWLADHSSSTFAQIRAILHPLSGTADAISYSPLAGILGGAPRNPDLKPPRSLTDQVRYAEHQYQYATVVVDLALCRDCGHRLQEAHRLTVVAPGGVQTVVGSVRRCRRCDADSWMFRSWMPSTLRRIQAASKIVL